MILRDPVVITRGDPQGVPSDRLSLVSRILLFELIPWHIVEHEPEIRIRAIFLLNIRVEIHRQRIVHRMDEDLLVERIRVSIVGGQSPPADATADLPAASDRVCGLGPRQILDPPDDRLEHLGRPNSGSVPEPDYLHTALVFSRLVGDLEIMLFDDVHRQAGATRDLPRLPNRVRPLIAVVAIAGLKLYIIDEPAPGVALPLHTPVEPFPSLLDCRVSGERRYIWVIIHDSHP